ncbi:efflux transporter periplasmic adaptor subunit [Pollutimonas subterranea]|uniref:Efflux transporter periplasmic adaptor subunit n=1 Tax=Pollutimonas subterranea TaxID=2045210 RepID=A0A2N4TZC9_9BURK|nr:efflux RND transporter periplasmic adaptor subunit [Pollutimonas subterranea]PLC48128.1 efflux transporter periplasmic adaptor subunit [Pollutimonas subterranea]
MKNYKLVVAITALGLVGASGIGMYQVGISQGMQMSAPATDHTTSPAEKKTNTEGAEPKILYWQDPMMPGQKFDKPGKSPFMDMQLVPVYAGGGEDEGAVTVSSRVTQSLGIRTAQVVKGSLSKSTTVVGNVAYNERDVAQIQARSNGFVERLHARATLDAVRKGGPLVDLYVPDWIAAQEDYLTARRLRGPGSSGLADAARQRMQLAGMNEEQIRSVISSGKVQARMSITSPIDGVVTELAIREGMTVSMGAPLFRINGISTVWVNAEIPENLASQVQVGNAVEASTGSLPGTVFHGKVSAILPDVSSATRTLKARIELANPSQQLIPGMFVSVSLASLPQSDVLLVPSEAVIQTGTRSIVMVAQDEGKFFPVEVQTGAEANEQTEIRKGLTAGQKVVTSGQFLLDSEASIKGTATRMDDGASSEKAAEPVHHATGTVKDINQNNITVSHEAIPSLEWPPMTMGFALSPQANPVGISIGTEITFELEATADGNFQITKLSPKANNPAESEHNNAHQHGVAK